MIFSDKGEYWRLLRPGKYRVKAQDKDGMHYTDFQTINTTSEVQIMNITLDKGRDKYFYPNLKPFPPTYVLVNKPLRPFWLG